MSWLNMPTGGHGHVICMCDDVILVKVNILTTQKPMVIKQIKTHGNFQELYINYNNRTMCEARI